MDIELRQLRYFIAVAEELHFSRAAARLQISQPTLSQAIQLLEQRLGVKLLQRSTRRVELTDAGARMLAEARIAIALIDDTVAAALDVSRVLTGVRVGSSPGGRYGIVGPILDRYNQEFPDAAIVLREQASGALLRALVKHELDVCVTFCASIPSELHSERLAELEALVILPEDDLRARRASVRLAELADLPLVIYADPDSAGFNALAIAACRRAGVVPRLVRIPHADAAAAFRRVRGFTFLPATARGMTGPGTALVPLAGSEPRLFYDLVWRDASVPGVAALLRVAREERAAQGWLAR